MKANRTCTQERQRLGERDSTLTGITRNLTFHSQPQRHLLESSLIIPTCSSWSASQRGRKHLGLPRWQPLRGAHSTVTTVRTACTTLESSLSPLVLAAYPPSSRPVRSPIIKEMHTKTTVRYHLTPVRMATIKHKHQVLMRV